MIGPYLRARARRPPFGTAFRVLDRSRFEFMAGEILCQGHYRFDTDNPAPLILDGGSNIGLSIVYFHQRHPNARIVGFEPDPAAFAALAENTAAFPNVEVINAALSREEGETDLWYTPGTDGSLTRSTIARRGGPERRAVRTIRLSDWIAGPVDFLKLDVEGAEHDVLADLVETRAIRHVQRMTIEYHHPLDGRLSAFLERLEDADFDYRVTANASLQETSQDVLLYCTRKPE
jgi:FkbM family methyltransferase